MEVTTGLSGGEHQVVTTTRHDSFSIVEYMTPAIARRKAAELISAAGRAERPAPGSEFPLRAESHA